MIIKRTNFNILCVNILEYYISGEGLTNIIRICMTDKFFSDFNKGLKQLHNSEAEVHAIICNEDGCNRKFKLPFPTRSTL